MNPLIKSYGTFCIGMGVYGISRNIRADNSRNELVSKHQIVCNALANSFAYSYPFINTIPLFQLYNRIQIQKQGLNKYNYPVYYKEFSGYCFDTY